MAGPTRGTAGGGDARDDDLDAQWADLTARLGDLSLPSDLPDIPEPAPREPTVAPALGPRDYAPGGATQDEEDPGRDLVDGFTPPEPQPLENAEPVLVLGWVGVLAGLATMLVCVLAWRSAPGLIWLVAAAALAVGAGLLLWRLPARRDADDYDDGAVI